MSLDARYELPCAGLDIFLLADATNVKKFVSHNQFSGLSKKFYTCSTVISMSLYAVLN